MNKKIFCIVLVAMLFALCFPVQAQQPKKIARIGYLEQGTAISANRFKPFQQGLRELGYVEGQNIIIEVRAAEGKRDRLPELMTELVHLNPDVIVTAGRGAQVAVQLTKTIPIVALGTSDILSRGLVASLARPGGNITGLSAFAPELTGKRLELLKETFPKIFRVAYLFDVADPSNEISLKELQSTAGPLHVTLQLRRVREPNEFAQAFSDIVRDRSEALLTATGGLNNNNRKRIVELAAKTRLPAMYPVSVFVDDGGLMSYGISLPAMYRRAAWYVDKILKGAKPADLPVEQPMKFEFVVNLKAAKQIGLTIPPNVLVRADKVIR
jgi:ABC-type uncharacterized transport system substrate-binding protein